MKDPKSQQDYSVIMKFLQVASLTVAAVILIYFLALSFCRNNCTIYGYPCSMIEQPEKSHVDLIELPSYEHYREEIQREVERENGVYRDSEDRKMV